MGKIGRRLRVRARDIGLSQAAVARAAGLSPERYGQYVRDLREPDFATLLTICRVLKTTPNALFGIDDFPATRPALPMHGIPADQVRVRHLETRPGMGAQGFENEEENTDDPEHIWLPERLVRHELRAAPEDLRSMEVSGPSMSPMLESGDQILVDLRERTPSQPGIFALFDGIGITVKWVELLPFTEPQRVRVSSENKRFKEWEGTLEEVHILGRVVWFARRL